MRKIGLLAVILSLFLAACQSTPEEALPTLAQFPTESPTATVTETIPPTNTLAPTDTPVPSATFTETEEPTFTPIPSDTATPTETPNNTQVAIGTGTASVLEAPRFATFTPIPVGAIGVLARPTSTGTPEVVADVIINEAQFQEEVNRLIANMPEINQAELNFVAERGVEIKLTALNSDAFITGTVIVPFNFSGGSFNNIVMIGGAVEITMPEEVEPSEEFLGYVTDIVVILQDAFNFILNQRLGEGQHNLEQIFITDEVMGIALLVPDPGQ